MYWGPLCMYVGKLSWMTKMYKYIKGFPLRSFTVYSRSINIAGIIENCGELYVTSSIPSGNVLHQFSNS